MQTYYRLSPTQVLDQLDVDQQGLTAVERQQRADTHGTNTIQTTSSRSWVLTFFRQFADLMIIILIVSAVLSRFLGEWRSAIVLVLIVIFNAIIGFIQEYKADRIMKSLASLVHPHAMVRIDGERSQQQVTSLVPGDIVQIQEGESVPADIRMIEVSTLASNDFALTGESNPVQKFVQQLHHEAELGDRNNMVFMGTTIARGRGTGVVVATGGDTILGQIASLSQTTKQDMSPLQRELTALSQKLSINVVVVGAVLFGVALLIDLTVYEAFLFALGICMSLVPQGMPAQISVALSLASARLAEQQVVVKKLSSVETLGSTTIICTDKTGTLTQNQMTVEELFVMEAYDGQLRPYSYNVSGIGYAPRGAILDDAGLRMEHDWVQRRGVLFQTSILASTARIVAPDEGHQSRYVLGDPTEGALITLAHKAGYDQDTVASLHEELRSLPFDSTRKMMSSVRRVGDQILLLTKGATDSILTHARSYYDGQEIRPMQITDVEQIHSQDAQRATQARRNLAFGYRDLTDLDRKNMSDEELESELIFVGLVSMTDPPREEVAHAIAQAQDAGIAIAIITGDYALTAEAIATKIGLSSADQQAVIVTGAQLDAMDDAAVLALFDQGNVIFSRTSPQDKLRIVTILKEHAHVVAVTGDGINDAPALKKADIGVAMGITGTDVSKDASDLILLKDNFSHLVHAIHEGRLIFQNLRTTILSSLTSNGGELFIILMSLICTGLRDRPIAITPILILCTDLIGEMGPLTALTRDPDRGDLMHQPPRDVQQHILNRQTFPDVVWAGFLMAVMTFGAFGLHLWIQGNGFSQDILTTQQYATAATVTYVTLLMCQYANILSRRLPGQTIWQSYSLTNRKLWISIIVSLVIVSGLIYIPAVADVVGTGPMSRVDRGLAIGGGLVFLCIREGQKQLSSKYGKS